MSTGVKSPMNFCLGLAKGFRNIPRLYHDDTVRPIEKVTDLSSGIKIAGKELGYGFFDGIAGLITQPIRGAEKDGAGGLVKGIGKGIGGLIAKPAAGELIFLFSSWMSEANECLGIWGLPAYMMQGVHAEVNKYFTRSVQNYIVTSRVVQGQQDLKKATPEEIADIIYRWNNAKFDLKNFYVMKRKEKVAEKAPAGPESESPVESPFSRPKTSWIYTRHLSSEDRKKLQIQKDRLKRGYVDAPVPPPSSSGSSDWQSISEDAEYEQAIQASVQETSRGNAEEDAMIEAAIRESVKAMRQRGGLPETVPELPEKNVTDGSIFQDEEYQITDEEYQTLVEQAIQQSLANMGYASGPHGDGIVELDAVETNRSADGGGPAPAAYPSHDEEDAELRRAIEESKRAPDPPPRSDDDGEEELERAIAASKAELEWQMSQRTEEDIVLEYVKQQSLAEEEYRRKIHKGKGKASEEVHEDEDDEDLKRALEESLRIAKGDDSGPSGSKTQEKEETADNE